MNIGLFRTQVVVVVVYHIISQAQCIQVCTVCTVENYVELKLAECVQNYSCNYRRITFINIMYEIF